MEAVALHVAAVVIGIGLLFLALVRLNAAFDTAAQARLDQLLAGLQGIGGLSTALSAGLLATMLTQSSSAVIIIAVVAAGRSAISLETGMFVVLGANVGSTVTGHLMTLQPPLAVDFALLLLGSLLELTAHPARRATPTPTRSLGAGLEGVGLLFAALTVVTRSLEPLARQPWFLAAFATVAQQPLLAWCSGVLLTSAVFSSGLTIGLLQQLAAAHALDISQALPILLGDNVGTTTDTLLAALGTGTAGRRLAIFHLLFNVALAFVYAPFSAVLGADGTTALLAALSGDPARQVALAHSALNMAGALAVIATRRLWLQLLGRMWQE